ncbi:predicted protein [Sclerotinia sclerotiorum 1980 UF-70]|uniref:Uncharacterized protein n=1 Tax=Sclerotinia sclerotiorum (strain ATCC 18683 / 1980 / Ss-1) TaxID=665079 RepID=A7F3K9_SCLS1|nr:predicted protein [Sclerotinia sclerotiorum 1980 UF-70]EDN97330.1 predicted protein [Sclerotinia sclerotiorum 1980 UF-70]
MPKHTPRLPGQPLQERPWAEPHIPEMLSRTLFREPTLARRQRQAQVQAQAQAQAQRPQTQVQSQGNIEGNTQHPSLEIILEPATPSSELQPMAHWYFHDQAANHYPEKHVSISTSSAYTTLQLSPRATEVFAGEEQGLGMGKGVWGAGRSVMGSGEECEEEC